LKLTQKLADFKFFKKIVDLVSKKTHLTDEGLKKVISIKASLNKGLSNTLKALQ